MQTSSFLATDITKFVAKILMDGMEAQHLDGSGPPEANRLRPSSRTFMDELSHCESKKGIAKISNEKPLHFVQDCADGQHKYCNV